jgi:sRNA-binding protein
LGVDHAKEVEKLKQQLVEAEARLQAVRAEAEQAPKQEALPQAQEARVNQEIQSGFSAPAPIVPTQAQQVQTIDSQNQVQALCQLAFQKGLDEAIKAAKSLNDSYIMDEFHDALVDKFYKQLVEQKKIEEV